MIWAWFLRLLMWFGERFAPWLIGLSAAVLAAQFDVLRKSFFWAFDAILDLVIFILNTACFDACLGVTEINPRSLLSALPADVLSALVDLGVPEALGIIICAYGVRLLLQLIPFTRLGS